MKFPNVIRSVFVLAFASAMHGQVVNPGGTGGGSGSGGSSGQYSTASVGYTVSAPYYFPPGGGLAASTTEAAVQGRVTIAGTIANFSASVSAAPGSNTITFTWRKRHRREPRGTKPSRAPSPARLRPVPTSPTPSP